MRLVGNADRLAPVARDAQLQAVTGGLFRLDAEERTRRQSGQAPHVSVICPTTEDRVLFHAQVYSCFASSCLEPKELVVVDTGLTGPSPVFLQVADNDPRLVYRHFRVPSHEWSVGLKRNIAVNLAVGEVIAHFDDDDLYSPEYLSHMLEAMQGSDLITLSSWFVFDLCTGLFAQADPLAEPFYDHDWVYGYGFSYVYRRDVCVEVPFPDGCHFAEDTDFLWRVQNSGQRSVRLRRDDTGLVLHMQHGDNLSNTHAHREVSLAEMQRSPLSRTPGFAWYATVFRQFRQRHEKSPFVTLGAAYITHLRPSEHRNAAYFHREFQSLGFVTCTGTSETAVLSNEVQEASAAMSCLVYRQSECIVEPGRLFSPSVRYPAAAVLPRDVPRVLDVERLALLHAARLLLRRGLRTEGWLQTEFHGHVQFHLRALSNVSVIPHFCLFIRHFPDVRLELTLAQE